MKGDSLDALSYIPGTECGVKGRQPGKGPGVSDTIGTGPGAGCTPQNRASYVDPVTGQTIRWGEVVRKGLKFLIDRQNDEGAIGPQVGEMMYNHSIAALARTEAYGITSAVAY